MIVCPTPSPLLSQAPLHVPPEHLCIAVPHQHSSRDPQRPLLHYFPLRQQDPEATPSHSARPRIQVSYNDKCHYTSPSSSSPVLTPLHPHSLTPNPRHPIPTLLQPPPTNTLAFTTPPPSQTTTGLQAATYINLWKTEGSGIICDMVTN